MAVTLNFTPVSAGTLTLTWVSDTTVINPTFSASFIGEFGDELTLDVSTFADFSVLYDTEMNTLDAIEAASGAVSFNTVSTLANSTTYYARLTRLRGGVAAYSNTVTKTMAAPPALVVSTTPVWWVDASNSGSITLSGTDVTQWNDIGTGGHNMTPNFSEPPVLVTNALNSRPGVSFTNYGNLRTASFTLPQPFMFVAVFKQSTTAPEAFSVLWAGRRDYSTASAIVFSRHNSFGDHYIPYAGVTGLEHSSSIAVNTPYHSRVLFDGSSSTSFLNGVTVSGDAGTDGISAGITLSGGSSHVTGTFSNAIVCEAFVIPYANHSAAVANAAADAANAASYILSKWGV